MEQLERSKAIDRKLRDPTGDLGPHDSIIKQVLLPVLWYPSQGRTAAPPYPCWLQYGFDARTQSGWLILLIAEYHYQRYWCCGRSF